jgi:hypothetical protein
MEDKICQHCSNKISLPIYRVTKKYWTDRKYCSYVCAQKASNGRPSHRKGKKIVSIEDSFWLKVKKVDESLCWEWIGAKDVILAITQVV